MTTLRVLLVEQDPNESQRISAALLPANHDVIPATDLNEASEALLIQKFDAILIGLLPPPSNVAGFITQLRSQEQKQRGAIRTPVLSFSDQMPALAQNTGIDAYLPRVFEASSLVEMVAKLEGAVSSPSASSTGPQPSDLTVFDAEEFRAQVAFDDDLMVEIIDLFLTERTGQMAEMVEALGARDYDRLARVAHTIKGSFGSLHAMLAKSHAQELEFAAKRKDGPACQVALEALESDLATLEPLLLSLRVSSSSR